MVLRGGKTVKHGGRGSWGEPVLDLPVEEEVFPAGWGTGIDGKDISFIRTA